MLHSIREIDVVMSTTALVTGGAGFIGSHLVDKLVSRGYKVVAIDNLSSGNIKNIRHHLENPSVSFRRIDLKHHGELLKCVKEASVVFHFAANPEVRVSTVNPRVHFEENLLTTFNLLDAVRQSRNIEALVFASSSAVYGDVSELPVSEVYPHSTPINVYGAVKLAGENLLNTFAKLYGFRAVSLRFANIVGPRSRHGVIYDFVMKLKKNSGRLQILGDGTQRRSFLYVDDAVEAILKVCDSLNCSVDVYNIGNDDWISVKEIADIVTGEMGKKGIPYEMMPATTDGRGWLGDLKFMFLNISKIKGLGWKPARNSYDAVRRTVVSLISELCPEMIE